MRVPPTESDITLYPPSCNDSQCATEIEFLTSGHLNIIHKLAIKTPYPKSPNLCSPQQHHFYSHRLVFFKTETQILI